MLKSLKKRSYRFVVVLLLLTTLLTFDVGRVTKVEAVATTASIAAAAFIGTALVYYSYLTFTGANVAIPARDNLRDWLLDTGKTVAKYPSGAATYQELYGKYSAASDPLANVIDDVWTWTEAKLKSFINDFSNTETISDISSFVASQVLPESINGHAYSYPLQYPAEYLRDNTFTFHPFSYYPYAIQYYDGLQIIDYAYNDSYWVYHTNLTNYEYRNYYNGSTYTLQYLNNGSWWNMSTVSAYCGTASENGNIIGYLYPSVVYQGSLAYMLATNPNNSSVSVANKADPPAINAPIYDSTTDKYLPLVVPSGGSLRGPEWTDPDNENRPIVPYVQIPKLPANINPPAGYTEPIWGLDLSDLLDKLEELANGMIDVGVIGTLINALAGLQGDNYYLYYDNDGDNYYYYYQPNIYDTDYITYNIDISDQEDIIPVDLNTIQQYTNNQYLTLIKERAETFGETFGELVAFWHNCDPEIIYAFLGASIIVLLGAFIGKWGHS